MEVNTKNNVSARGKQGILLIAAGQDRGQCSDKIIQDILSLANCAIYSFESDQNTDISRFSVCVLIVSKNMIENKKDYIEIYNKLISDHIPIIPIAIQPGIKSMFSKEFGKSQCIIRDDENDLKNYYKELGSRLKDIISSDEIAGRIKNAFNCHAFLSYRKRDSEKAKKVIRFLRKCKKLDDAAIWYDEYLLPGENYETVIEEEIKNCDIFVMVISKNIVEKTNNEDGRSADNYVIRVEYPLALKHHKPVIPIMVDDLDKDSVSETFLNICDPISFGKTDELEKRINEIDICSNDESGDSLYAQYLRGIAFLNGIFTEPDVKKGIKILKHAADKGQKEAIVKLAQMYYYGEHVSEDWQCAAKYYKKLIDEVEKSGSVKDYPYCYNNYASAISASHDWSYTEVINIFENGINVLRENINDDNEYLFYFALTLAGYRNAIFSAMYDEGEGFDQIEIWIQKRDMAYKEAISILNKLLQRDEFDEKSLALKATIEKEIAENSSLPEAEYLARKENNGELGDEFVRGIEEKYSAAINDMKSLYELNPLDKAECYIGFLYNTVINLMESAAKEKVLEWAEECKRICEETEEGLLDEEFEKSIKSYKISISIALDYMLMDLLSFIKKYNDILQKGETYLKESSEKWLMRVEISYLQQDIVISNEILSEIKKTIEYLNTREIRDEDHIAYVGLNIEYAYKGDVEKDIISPDEYRDKCGKFYASPEQRCFLGNRLIEIARQLCMKGKGYKSALNCMEAAVQILLDLAERNNCYLGDYIVAVRIRDNFSRMLPMLNENKKLRAIFIPEEILLSEDSGIYVVEADS